MSNPTKPPSTAFHVCRTVVLSSLIISCTAPGARVQPAGQILLSGDSIGPVPSGVTRLALSRFATIARDTVEEGLEAIPESVTVVVVAGDTLRVAVDGGRAYRLSVSSPRFRTTDSLGPGIPLARLLREPGLFALTGEGAVYVQSPRHCGLSFHLSESGALADSPDSVGAAALRTLPARTTVDAVSAFGCRRARSSAPPG